MSRLLRPLRRWLTGIPVSRSDPGRVSVQPPQTASALYPASSLFPSSTTYP